MLWRSTEKQLDDGTRVVTYSPQPTDGSDILRPGNHPQFSAIRSDKLTDKLNFVSLMLALFAGTASLPHILIRYYTVKDQASARKSTVVGIGSIGFFYVLTLYLGLGAMTSGALDVTDTQHGGAAVGQELSGRRLVVRHHLGDCVYDGAGHGERFDRRGQRRRGPRSLAQRYGANDDRPRKGPHRQDFGRRRRGDRHRAWHSVREAERQLSGGLGVQRGRVGQSTVAGDALFWNRTTKQGISAAILVGMLSSLAWILLSGDTFKSVYGLPAEDSPVPFSQPGIVTIPLGFVVLVVVSLLTQPKRT